MIPLAKTDERIFGSLQEVKAHLAARNFEAYEIPLGNVQMSDMGELHILDGGGPLTKYAFLGLIGVLGIPWPYAVRVCPTGLLIHSIQKLMQHKHEQRVRIQIVDDVVTAIMSPARLPMPHQTLTTWLGTDRPIHEAVLSGGILRITLIRATTEVAPGSILGIGWEILNDETGWWPTQLWRYALEQGRGNGFLGFEDCPVFTRRAIFTESICNALQKLTDTLEDTVEIEGLDRAVQRAIEQCIGRAREEMVDQLVDRLEGRATRLLLRNITQKSSYYDLATIISSAARTHRLPMRRRYELDAGLLLVSLYKAYQTSLSLPQAACQNSLYLPTDSISEENHFAEELAHHEKHS
jgi:hypothetical protein